MFPEAFGGHQFVFHISAGECDWPYEEVKWFPFLSFQAFVSPLHSPALCVHGGSDCPRVLRTLWRVHQWHGVNRLYKEGESLCEQKVITMIPP